MDNKIAITTTLNGETRTDLFDGAFVIGIDEEDSGYKISFVNNITIEMALSALQQGIANNYVGKFQTEDKQ